MHACTLWCPLARDNDQELIPGTHWSLNYAHSERSWVPNKVGLERCLLNKVINKVTGGELRIIHTALQGWTCEFNYSAYEHDALLPEVILISCRHSDLWPMTSTSFSTQLPLTGYFLFWDHSLESSSGQKQPCSPCSKSLAVPFFPSILMIALNLGKSSELLPCEKNSGSRKRWVTSASNSNTLWETSV